MNIKSMSKEELVSWLIICLSDGCKEAMKDANAVRERAKELGDQEFINHIDYLFDAI